jgi:hypothetical protein
LGAPQKKSHQILGSQSAPEQEQLSYENPAAILVEFKSHFAEYISHLVESSSHIAEYSSHETEF